MPQTTVMVTVFARATLDSDSEARDRRFFTGIDGTEADYSKVDIVRATTTETRKVGKREGLATRAPTSVRRRWR